MDSRHTLGVLARLLAAGILAAGVMLAIVGGLLHVESATVESIGRIGLLVNVVVSSIVGTLVFVGAAWAMRVRDIQDVLSLLGRMTARVRPRGGQA